MIATHVCTKNVDGPAAQFQDARYGVGRRVFTEAPKPTNTVRCTVCGAGEVQSEARKRAGVAP